MAYCSNCGAYLPDGETVCLACGADSSAPKNANAPFSGGAATAFAENGRKTSGAPTSEELRRQLEEKRRRQKEKNSEWARQVCSERKKENQHRASAASGSTGAQRTADTARPKDPKESGRIFGKVLALLSYFSFFCVLPFLLTPEDPFARFHAKQGILLLLMSLALDVLSAIAFPLIWVISLARIYLVIKGIINVLNDRKEYLPFIGKYAEQFLKF